MCVSQMTIKKIVFVEVITQYFFLYILCLFTGFLNKSITTDGTRGCELAYPSESVDNLLLSTQSLVFSSILPSVDGFFSSILLFYFTLFPFCLFVCFSCGNCIVFPLNYSNHLHPSV
jgi:hypothetical protein